MLVMFVVSLISKPFQNGNSIHQFTNEKCDFEIRMLPCIEFRKEMLVKGKR